jgi:hypothetical protein
MPVTRASTIAMRNLTFAAALTLCGGVLAACGDDSGGGDGVGTGSRDAGNGSPDAGPDASANGGSGGDISRPPGRDGGSDGGPQGGEGAEDDGGVISCRTMDCSELDDECSVGMCDPDTVTCISLPRADGSACGSATLDDCTAPDECQAGVCVPNDQPEGTDCGDQGVACHLDDACDGHGQCTDNGVRPVGTACGSAAENGCTAPDSCDELGVCQPNNAAVDTPCTDLGQELGVLCKNDDLCDGNGQCVDTGNWAPGTVCSNTPVTACHPAQDVCVAGECQINNVPNFPVTTCGDPSDTQCDNPDTCVNGLCSANNEPTTHACGSSASNAPCDLPDRCDGAGSCDARIADSNTVCGTASGDCFQDPRCNGLGACGAELPALAGTMCQDQTDTTCNGADTCDGAGNCDDNFAPATTECGAANGPCDATDMCNGSGGCTQRFAAAGTVCGDAGVQCHVPDTCNASGACHDNGFLPLNEPCGDGGTSECDNADSCDAAGSCRANHVPSGTACGGTPDACMAQDTCDDTGACHDNGAQAGGCFADLTGFVTDVQGDPVAGVAVDVLGSSPLETATTGVDGMFQVAFPVGVDTLLRVHPSASAFGVVAARYALPGDTDLGTLIMIDDTLLQDLLSASGVDAVDTSRGMLDVSLNGASGAGGESAMIAAACTPSSCGPLVVDDAGQALASNTLVPDGQNDVIFINLPAGNRTPSVAGAAGVNSCSLANAISSWPVYAHTLTLVAADCGP